MPQNLLYTPEGKKQYSSAKERPDKCFRGHDMHLSNFSATKSQREILKRKQCPQNFSASHPDQQNDRPLQCIRNIVKLTVQAQMLAGLFMGNVGIMTAFAQNNWQCKQLLTTKLLQTDI